MSTSDWGKIYKEMGARPVINATGSVTLLGGSTPVPEVREAMEAADSAYVPLIDLESVVGKRIAELLNVPAAYVTSGAGSALTLATAALMAGTDDEKIQQLPNTDGMPNEILLQRRQQYWYDRCLELAGARIVLVGTDEGTTADDLRRAISEKTAGIHYPVFEQNPVDPNVLSLEEVIDVANGAGKSVTVDGAGQIYPLENLGKYVRMGAVFQAVAAKYMSAPQSSGLALGTEEFIDAISRQSFIGYETRRIRGVGRPQKVDRQEIVGALVAVERWMNLNHEERLAYAEEQSYTIIKSVSDVPGIKATLINNIVSHHPFGVYVNLDPSVAGISNAELVAELKEADPPIWTRVVDGRENIEIHTFAFSEGQAKLVGEAIAQVVRRKQAG